MSTEVSNEKTTFRLFGNQVAKAEMNLETTHAKRNNDGIFLKIVKTYAQLILSKQCHIVNVNER